VAMQMARNNQVIFFLLEILYWIWFGTGNTCFIINDLKYALKICTNERNIILYKFLKAYLPTF
jgi:hypothetical protein